MTTINCIIIASLFGVLGNIAGRLRAFFYSQNDKLQPPTHIHVCELTITFSYGFIDLILIDLIFFFN